MKKTILIARENPNSENGVEFQEFKTVKACANFIGCSKSNIYQAAGVVKNQNPFKAKNWFVSFE